MRCASVHVEVAVVESLKYGQKSDRCRVLAVWGASTVDNLTN